VKVADWAREATLRVDAAGDAEVDWTGSGGRQSVVISRRGEVRYGGRLDAPDTSHPVTAPALPWLVAVRQTLDGSFYALQSWQRLDDGPVELRFSRWRGEPTKLTLRAVCCKWGSENVEGKIGVGGHRLPRHDQRPELGLDARPRRLRADALVALSAPPEDRGANRDGAGSFGSRG
jgi:hypothetical protein